MHKLSKSTFVIVLIWLASHALQRLRRWWQFSGSTASSTGNF